MLRRFDYRIEKVADGHAEADPHIRLTPDLLVETEPTLASILDPFCSVPLNPTHSIRIVKALGSALARLIEKHRDIRNVSVNLDDFSRSSICIILSSIASYTYFRNIEFIYSLNKYSINGSDLHEMLKGDEFWYRVHDYPSKLTAIPFLGGRFDASTAKSVFVCGGLDFGRVLNVSARWEPSKIFLVTPAEVVSGNELELVNAYDLLISRHTAVGRIDISGLLSALDDWKISIDKERAQPLLVIGGWKIHSISACLWALENQRIPAFICVPDFIAPGVTRNTGPRWRLLVSDQAVVV